MIWLSVFLYFCGHVMATCLLNEIAPGDPLRNALIAMLFPILVPIGVARGIAKAVAGK